MFREFFISCRKLFWSVAKRYYIWIFAILDPLDIWNRLMAPFGFPVVELTPLGSWVVSIFVIIVVILLAYHELRLLHEPRVKASSPMESEAQKAAINFINKNFIPTKGKLYTMSEGVASRHMTIDSSSKTYRFIKGAGANLGRVLDPFSHSLSNPETINREHGVGSKLNTLIGNYIHSCHRSIELMEFVSEQEYVSQNEITPDVHDFLNSHSELINSLRQMVENNLFDVFQRGVGEKRIEDLQKIQVDFASLIQLDLHQPLQSTEEETPLKTSP